VETAPAQKPVNLLYNRQSNSIESGRTNDLSDLGILIIGTEGAPAAGIAGELWVTYRCRLSRPIFISNLNTTVAGNAQLTSNLALTMTNPVYFPNSDSTTGWNLSDDPNWATSANNHYIYMRNNSVTANTTIFWSIHVDYKVKAATSVPAINGVSFPLDGLYNNVVTANNATLDSCWLGSIVRGSTSWPSSTTNGGLYNSDAGATQIHICGIYLVKVAAQSNCNGVRVGFNISTTTAAGAVGALTSIFNITPRVISEAEYNKTKQIYNEY